METTKIIALVLVAVAASDLALGNTNQPLLPPFIGNYLNQQTDLLLIGAGAVLWFLV